MGGKSGSGSRKTGNIVRMVIICVTAAVYAMPVIVTFLDSFASSHEISEIIAGKSATLFPRSFSLIQYYDLLVEKARYAGMFWNSILYSTSITAANLVISVLTGFAFAKCRFRGRKSLLILYIIIMMMPFQVTLLPNYLVSKAMGILDTGWAVILPGIFSPFGTFLLAQFFRYIPDESIDAFLLESKSVWGLLSKAVLPSAKPGIVALAVISFAENWNMVEQPLVLINDVLKRPLSAEFNSVLKAGADVAFAGSFFYMVPVIILCLYFEENIAQGLAEWSRAMGRL